MELFKDLIQGMGIHTLIYLKDFWQSKGRHCPHIGYLQPLKDPEPALYLSVIFLLARGRDLTFSGGSYYCHDCKGDHFKNGSFLAAQGALKIFHKPALQKILIQLQKEVL